MGTIIAFVLQKFIVVNEATNANDNEGKTTRGVPRRNDFERPTIVTNAFS